MGKVYDQLQAVQNYNISFEQGKVVWNKELLLSLRELGYRLELEDHATRVFLYREEKCLGEVPYVRQDREPDFEYTERYEVMLLDLKQF
jgi:hypothetical protein